MKHYQLAKEIPAHHILRKQYPKLIAQLLFNRGIKTKKEAEKFLHPQWEDNYDPFLLHGMEKSLKRFYKAIQNNEKITIYADYDADGIPGAVILSRLLDAISYQHYDIYIPHRHNEGYGIHREALKKIKESGTKLIISIDVGITAIEAGLWCKQEQIDLIITDHHIPQKNKSGKEKLPEAYSIINPKQEACHYPDSMICGAGVIFKFVQAFLQNYRTHYAIPEGWEKWLLDMLGIATLSDMVPLRDENRLFAFYGMKVLQKINEEKNTRQLGLKYLMQEMEIPSAFLNEENITFGITPKINAASRMSHPEEALAVLKATNEGEAQVLGEHISLLNNERKKLTQKTTIEAINMLSQQEQNDVIVVGKADWKAGILGLVASKLVEKYRLPAFVWSEENGEIKGSCRSLDEIHLVDLMSGTTKDTFLHFGGHAGAGGFSCKINEVEKLKSRLQKSLEKYKKKHKKRKKEILMVDTELNIDAISVHNYQEMRKLAPFGVGNSKPLFIFRDVLLESVGTFGKDKNHLEISFKNSLGKLIRGIAFFKTPIDFEKLEKGKVYNILAHIEYSIFRGKHELRLSIVDFF